MLKCSGLLFKHQWTLNGDLGRQKSLERIQVYPQAEGPFRLCTRWHIFIHIYIYTSFSPQCSWDSQEGSDFKQKGSVILLVMVPSQTPGLNTWIQSAVCILPSVRCRTGSYLRLNRWKKYINTPVQMHPYLIQVNSNLLWEAPGAVHSWSYCLLPLC